MKHLILFFFLFLLFRTSPVLAGEWQIVSRMPVPVSGAVAFIHDSLIYIFGGHNSRDFITSPIVQIYNPTQNTWHLKTIGTIQYSRYGATGGIWQGTAYFFGGQTDNIRTNMVVWNLPNISESGMTNNNDNFNRYFASSEIYNGKLYCFGGYSVNSTDVSRSKLPYIFIYDFATNRIETEIMSDYTNELPYYQMTARIYDRIFILGGAFNGVLNTISYLDTENNTLHRFERKMSKARYGGTAHALGDSALILIGGWNGRDRVLSDVEVIKINNQPDISNLEIVDLNYARAEHVSVIYANDLYVFGGRSTANDSTISTVEKYDLGPITGIADKIQVQPVFKLYENYPNPFNSSTQIRYHISETARVEVKIFDITGRLIKTLLDEFQHKGVHQVSFNASSLTSGVYFYSLNSCGQSQTKRMIFIK